MRLFWVLFLSLLGSIALADSVQAKVQTPNWSMESTERIPYGEVGRISYPLWHLTDGNPATTWVFSESKADYEKGINIWFEKPAAATKIVIWNGYTKSPELFEQNSRAAVIEIRTDAFTKKVTLADTAAPTRIKLLSRKFEHLKLTVLGVKEGEIRDFCISEIQILNGSRNLLSRSGPFAQTFGSGDDCGCGGVMGMLRAPDGKPLIKTQMGWDNFSPSGRFFAGISERRAFLFDRITNQVVDEKAVRNFSGFVDVNWINERTVKIDDGEARTYRLAAPARSK